jgi:hypothetical protein
MLYIHDKSSALQTSYLIRKNVCECEGVDDSHKHLVAINGIKNGSSEEDVTSFHSTHLDRRIFDKSSVQWYRVLRLW